VKVRRNEDVRQGINELHEAKPQGDKKRKREIEIEIERERERVREK
jgi:hypothetical protein